MSHNPELVEHVDVFPSVSLKTGLAFVKGDPVTTSAVSLAAVNIESYACGQFFGSDPVPMFAALAAVNIPSKDEAIAAFEAVMPDDSGTMKAGVGKGQWLTILKTLLPLILQLLA